MFDVMPAIAAMTAADAGRLCEQASRAISHITAARHEAEQVKLAANPIVPVSVLEKMVEISRELKDAIGRG
jgi:hypothetical protein